MQGTYCVCETNDRSCDRELEVQQGSRFIFHLRPPRLWRITFRPHPLAHAHTVAIAKSKSKVRPKKKFATRIQPDVISVLPEFARKFFVRFQSRFSALLSMVQQWRSQNRVVGRAQVGHTYGAAQRRRKVLTIGGAPMMVRAWGVWGHAPAENYLKLGALRLLLRTQIYIWTRCR